MVMYSSIVVRSAELTDAPAITAIYNQYVRTTAITFEESEVGVGEMIERIADVKSKHLPWNVAFEGDTLVGYAYATPWRSRSAYRFAVEVTVYVAPDRMRRRIGASLYVGLLDAIRNAGYRTVIGGIALPNVGSVALHERFGFEKVAHFRDVGFKMGRWIDVGYWQLNWNTDDNPSTPEQRQIPNEF